MGYSEKEHEARVLINSVHGKKINLEERIEKAITLAALILDTSKRISTHKEKKRAEKIGSLVTDPAAKLLITSLTDQCFRSKCASRVADQVAYVISSHPIPSSLSVVDKIALASFEKLGDIFSSIAVPLLIAVVRKETEHVILPGEEKKLAAHLKMRAKQGVRVNLNHLGEAILGEDEALKRLAIYLVDLSKPEVECISIKISTICSQINLLSWEDTLAILSERLRLLYRAALKHSFLNKEGNRVQKLINLDMEEYRDLHLTVALFRKVLDEGEFFHLRAGIVLQSYLPDSFLIQQELTLWAMGRVSRGGAPIKIRIVKGANLAMEQFESVLKLWPQAPYTKKSEVDANYKRMVEYGCQVDHAKAVHLGIASHNLFDIAYGLLLRSENEVESCVCFEMLEGMADASRRVVQNLSSDILLYCPAATKEEFQNAIAYLVRRLDENTAPHNFLRHAFNLEVGSSEWFHQAELFATSCREALTVSYLPRRVQNRFNESFEKSYESSFSNVSDTDWAEPQNRKWVEEILKTWKAKEHPPIPLVIGGEIKFSSEPAMIGIGRDPSSPDQILYQFTKASKEMAETALETAASFFEPPSLHDRIRLLENIAYELKKNRAMLIGAIVADSGKTVIEADGEVSEAIDFANYYRCNIEQLEQIPDISWKPKGAVLVASPWNFPCSIPSGGIIAALACGNAVIFKPSEEAVLVGWHLAQLLWRAGVSRKQLQFLTCEDDPVGSFLVKDERISLIVLTGATETAKLFMRMRPGIDLTAETGGKNVMVISAMADRDLAVKDLVQSAFGYSGQKCSACSLAILEAEVYDDPQFLKQLCDAVSSLPVGSAWDLKTKINPLIKPPSGDLKRSLRELEKGESWLLEPAVVGDHPNLWRPGIKMGVTVHSHTFQKELFGPVLGLVRASSFEEALFLMNQTRYGLTAGLHTLDDREKKKWLENVVAGNCYINRTMTGAIVQRQPFGGCKESGFGKGSKAGGPNYLIQFMRGEQKGFPKDCAPVTEKIEILKGLLSSLSFFKEKEALWNASVGSYAYYWRHLFSISCDKSEVRGQDNLLYYVPHSLVVLRFHKEDDPFDLFRVMAAATLCGTFLEISLEDDLLKSLFNKTKLTEDFSFIVEDNDLFAKRALSGAFKRVRFLRKPQDGALEALAESSCNIHMDPVLANGRVELLNYLREVSLSHDTHRYGYIGSDSG